ncbi:MAG: AAA family ATPase [Sedimentisphaerales bacterium]|nr:AAA family ATPase [Sedimentisphaerales bacterium]
MRTIAIVNQKGGCGKTTVSINLASALADLNKKVLLVDMDPQSHCAVGLAVPEDQIEQSIYDVLISSSRNEPTRLTEILWQISERLELAPASLDLSAFEQQMVGVTDRELCLRNALDELKNDYDYAIIDCPPAVSLLTFNALRAADEVIVPVETGYFALHGLSRQLETLSVLCRRCSQQVDVRVLASMYDIRTKMAREILAELRSHFAEKMFKTVICFNTKIKEASSFGQPISEYDPASKGHKDFTSLAEEVLGEKSKQQRHEFVNSLADQLESISATADELLKTTKPPVTTEPVAETPEPVLRLPVEEFTLPKRTAELPRLNDLPKVDDLLKMDELMDVDQLPELTELRIEEPKMKVQAAPKRISTEAKLSDYYGVSQMEDAVVFVTLYPRAGKVQVAGDFNDWQPENCTMQKVGESGIWQTEMNLTPGRYRYRLVVDGQWQQDPYNELTEMNPFGGYNSVVEVK